MNEMQKQVALVSQLLSHSMVQEFTEKLLTDKNMMSVTAPDKEITVPYTLVYDLAKTFLAQAALLNTVFATMPDSIKEMLPLMAFMAAVQCKSEQDPMEVGITSNPPTMMRQ